MSCVGAVCLLVGATARGVTFTVDTAIGAGDGTYEGQDIVVQGCTLTVDGSHSFNSLVVTASGIVTHSPATTSTLSIAQDVAIDVGCRLDAAGKGNAAGGGSGAGVGGGGGGYGGYGGEGAIGGGGGETYGSPASPNDLGSGGGNGPESSVGGLGGGSVQITASGTFSLDGVISVNGGSAESGGGGSGGSVAITAGTFAGTGSVTADGGTATTGGGGAGGRISIRYMTNTFDGSLSAVGGSGQAAGGPGTIYRAVLDGSRAALSIDNGGQVGATSLIPGVLPTPTVDLTVGGKASLLVGSSSQLLLHSLHVTGGAVLSNKEAAQGLRLAVETDAIVDSGAGIDTDGRGELAGQGLGGGQESNGASYGGYGGAGPVTGSLPCEPYGSMTLPQHVGSGGGSHNGSSSVGGAGGGLIAISVNGTFTHNGTISANGQDGAGPLGGGGSGGGILVMAGVFGGSGSIVANGGAARAGGGAGGRIAIEYNSLSYDGTTVAAGGNGHACGGPGSIYKYSRSDSRSTVLIDNGGRSGLGQVVLTGLTNPADLKVAGGAMVRMDSPRTLHSLQIVSNGGLMVDPMASSLDLKVQTDALIGPGSILSGDAVSIANGTGAGTNSNSYAGGGAAHGGFGGVGEGDATGLTSGTPSGNFDQPASSGYLGGNGYQSIGGNGGGYIRLTVTNTLTLDGTVSASGSSGSGAWAGGGSGGSLWITAGTLAGSGGIAASGGAAQFGGGGGGGRVAVYYTSSSFAGTMTALGGAGYNYGGAGTVYTKGKADLAGSVRIDNGGHRGQTALGTRYVTGTAMSLTVAGSSLARIPSPCTVRSLLVTSDGVLVPDQQSLELVVDTDATVTAGSVLGADGSGSGAGDGTGAGANSTSYGGGGASYGGYGGSGLGEGVAAKIPFGNLLQPQDLGSGGGNGYQSTGGNGGGYIKLTVTGKLIVGGTISANGVSGSGALAGGGSGGSLQITAGGLAGEGAITADGGAAQSGGGGAGGRIAVRYASSSFAGTMTAWGGAGYNPGGPGTVLVQASADPQPSIRIDNGGRSGQTRLLSGDMPGVQPVLTVAGSAMLQVSALTLRSLRVTGNAAVVASTSGVTVDLTVLDDVMIDPGSSLNADGKGSTAGNGGGPGVGSTTYGGGGAAHGGFGGSGSGGTMGGVPYGSLSQPTVFGSGGGNGYQSTGGNGGGAIKLTITGLLTVGGTISANGMSGLGAWAGGGSGGSVYVTTGSLAGAGTITASGGATQSGGGGAGGRIAIYYTNSSFAGTTSAFGGVGYSAGGAGTVYTKASAEAVPSIRIDNGGSSGQTRLSQADMAVSSAVTVAGGAVVRMVIATPPCNLRSLLVTSNAMLVPDVNQKPLDLTVETDAALTDGGALAADGFGNTAASGAGAGASSPSYGGSGAGHGGFGGTGQPNMKGGKTYGSISQPQVYGSGGGNGCLSSSGGNGGGVIKLAVKGTLTVGGAVRANGVSGTGIWAGAGSGGSVWITAASLAGSGTICANGGAAQSGGGGGGGRIALYYKHSTFEGATAAFGGAGFTGGGAGTVYTKASDDPVPHIGIDNGGRSGMSLLSSADLTGTQPAVVVTGSSMVQISSAPTFDSLDVTSNAVLLPVDGADPQPLDLTVLHDARIDSGSFVSADGKGYARGRGSGPGTNSNSYGGGGGAYGGLGGSGQNGGPGGSSYGDLKAPVDFGSGGGDGGQGSLGGSGGGYVRLAVNGLLTLNGTISATGTIGTGDWAGGGSGGSVRVSAQTLAGSGRVLAGGGGGAVSGGGGGGGRIALSYANSTFSGTSSAYGGSGYVCGGAGTIYTTNLADPDARSQLYIDNSTASTGTTRLSNSDLGFSVDLTVAGRTLVQVDGGTNIHSLHLATDATLSCLKGSFVDVRIEGDAVLDAGSFINVDWQGSGGHLGPGAGTNGIPYDAGGGGGYGGLGGSGQGGATGGVTYGAVNEVSYTGSGGGHGYSSAGGAGGGRIVLDVQGSLLANGAISANGGIGIGFWGGGGSGGGIEIRARTLAGAGSIAAGGGGSLFGGGGGGGRIALHYFDNSFTGTVRVAGGEGYSMGGAGTIYWPGDVNADGAVDVFDLLAMAGSWGKHTGEEEYDPACDFDNDGSVDVLDLLILAEGFGK